MSESVDRARPGLFASGSPMRTVVVVLLAYAVLGAVAGFVWEKVWTPPGQIIAQHQVFFDSYASLRRVFTGTGLYVLVGAAAGALASLVVALLARGRELLTLALVIVGSAIAAAVMLKVGTMLGPGDPTSIARHTTQRTPVPGALTVQGKTLWGVKSPYLIWPMSSLLVLALVFFAWPASHLPHRHGDMRATGRHDDAPAGRHDADVAVAAGAGRHQLTDLPPERQRLADEIRAVRFSPVRIRQGYEMGTVDRLLDRAADALTRGESLVPVLDVPLPTVRMREGYDKAEVEGLLTRLRESPDATDAHG
jgi:DivIVA domain-containing protein